MLLDGKISNDEIDIRMNHTGPYTPEYWLPIPPIHI